MKYLFDMGISCYLFPRAQELKLDENWWEEIHRASQFDLESYFASLVRPLGNKNDVEEACRKYKLSRSIIRFSTQLVSELPYLNSENFSTEKTYHLIKKCGDNSSKILNYGENILRIKSNALTQSIIQFEKISNVIQSPFVNGGDLHKIGIKPGPRFREILDKAALMQIEGYTKEAILDLIKNS
jgi:hypothetical protein